MKQFMEARFVSIGWNNNFKQCLEVMLHMAYRSSVLYKADCTIVLYMVAWRDVQHTADRQSIYYLPDRQRA